jgi:hypothetical protein
MRLMKQLGLMVGCAFVASLPLTAAEVTVKGEVVDQACFLKDKSRGADHKDCGTGCVKKGQPAALVTADGQVYTIVGDYAANKNAKLVDLVAKTVEAKGEVTEKDGKKMIAATSISEAK